MQGLVSICIPTCDRPVLLRAALDSCLAQSYRPLEILVGDDSQDEGAEAVVDSLGSPDGIVIRYKRHSSRLGQAANVNELYARASGARLVLLHDDDLLCPDAVALLDAAWDENPGVRCAYGKQTVLDDDGTVLPDATACWNRTYYRRPENAGAQPSGLVAGILQQIPNNGFLIETALAREIGLRSETEIGQCVDADFGIRAGRAVAPGAYVFVDSFTSCYRLTAGSIARSALINRRRDLFFTDLEGLAGGREVDDAKTVLLNRLVLGASVDAAVAGERRTALRILFSRYNEKPLLSRWTFYRLTCIAFPVLGPRFRRFLRSFDERPPHAIATLGFTASVLALLFAIGID